MEDEIEALIESIQKIGFGEMLLGFLVFFVIGMLTIAAIASFAEWLYEAVDAFTWKIWKIKNKWKEKNKKK